MTIEEFEQFIRHTIQYLPKKLLTQLDNVKIVIEENPPHNLPLQGQYDDIPKTKRYSYFALPDKITIYKQPLLLISKNEEETKENIKNTV
ncbi:MAG TPA: metallopeptidase family protein [Candidatus Sulfotelmatobacter sp.]|jgi:predicted Zn-dependent protease with MMP-like domain|nr:metallopeptidase family protein [Candidatus Sulfotelmatobacter sp.]